jgi:hypothetical protein
MLATTHDSYVDFDQELRLVRGAIHRLRHKRSDEFANGLILFW